jgi:hypothetical protein
MKNRVLLIKILGIILLVIGLFSLFAIPAEFTSFYAFSEGGNSQYEGFGFGSLMFAFIIFNTMVYFSLALLCIPIGIGNYKLKKWGYNLSLASLKTLLINGIATTVSILLSFNLLNIVNIYRFVTILILFFAFLIILPYYLIKFYQNTKTKQIFNIFNPKNLFEEQSSSNLTIILLNLFWILIFYLFIFFKGAFPLLGEFILMKKGTYLLSIAIFTLLILTYLFYNDKKYVKSGMLIYDILLFFTFAITFLKNSTNDFFNLLDLPVYEVENVVPAFAIPAEINLGFYFGILIFVHVYLIITTKTKK